MLSNSLREKYCTTLIVRLISSSIGRGGYRSTRWSYRRTHPSPCRHVRYDDALWFYTWGATVACTVGKGNPIPWGRQAGTPGRREGMEHGRRRVHALPLKWIAIYCHVTSYSARVSSLLLKLKADLSKKIKLKQSSWAAKE
jgi:hypothetical protein